MDKIIMELPDWTDEINIHILSGMEEVARRLSNIWYIKTERCNNCGQCCMDVPEGWPHGYNPDTGHCLHLKEEVDGKFCGLKLDRPYTCCISEGELQYCKIRWQKIE